MQSDMGQDPMGGDASFMGAPQQDMGTDPMAGGGMDDGMDTGMDGENEPVMGSKPFDSVPKSEVTDDPEKKVESLIGQAASVIRKDLNSDGINKHEDKKKEVLGMLVSAVVDGMDDEERNGIIDYLSDKLNGDIEGEGGTDGESTGAPLDANGSQDMGADPMAGGMDNGMDAGTEQPQDGMDQPPMMEEMIREITNGVLSSMAGAECQRKASKPSSKTPSRKKGYNSKPYEVR